MKLFSRTASPLSLEPPSPCATPPRQHSIPPSPPRRPRLRHGAPPFFEGWAGVRVDRSRRTDLRYCTLSGAHLRYSATPGQDILAGCVLVYGAVVTEELPGLKVVIRSQGLRVALHAESREEHAAFLAELQRASRRCLTDVYRFQADLRPTPFGRTSRAVDTATGVPVSVKVTCKEGLSPLHVACARKEAVVLLSMPEHANIVSIADVYESARSVYLVTRDADAKSLNELVSERGSLCEAEVAGIIKGLLRALVHLKACKVIHRLICPENVLVVPTKGRGVGIPALSNFELAMSSVDVEDTPGILDSFSDRGPWYLRHAAYLAPEVASGEVGDYKQDVWSLGILMHYLLIGYTPFEGGPKTRDQLIRTIACTRGMPNFSGSLWRGVTSVAKHLCASMLHADPKLRVSASQALEHPWLNM